MDAEDRTFPRKGDKGGCSTTETDVVVILISYLRPGSGRVTKPAREGETLSGRQGGGGAPGNSPGKGHKNNHISLLVDERGKA